MSSDNRKKEPVITFVIAFMILLSFFVVNSPDGFFSITGHQAVSNGTLSLQIVVIDTLPVVVLDSPINNSVITINNVSLVCNASDNAIVNNITVYHDINGTFGPNETITVNAQSASVEFNFTNLTSGEYHWNCFAYDNTGNSAFAEDNWTFYIMNLNFTVLINGSEVDQFPKAGVPYNLTVLTRDNNSGLPIDDVHIVVEETNSLSFFSMPQISGSNVSSIGVADTTTNPLGQVSMTVIPTGGIPAYDSNLGGYNITVKALDANGNVMASKRLTVTDRNTIGTARAVSIPNSANIGYSITKSFQLWSSLNDYMNDAEGSGINHPITYNDTTSTATGTGFTLYSSQPAGFKVRVVNASGAIQNAIVNITESMGYYIFAFPQYSDPINNDVTNTHTGSALTNSTGWAEMTLIPTGGSTAFDTYGPYFVRMYIYHPDGTLLYQTGFTVDRTIIGPDTFTLEDIPNEDNIGTDTTKMIILVSNINEHLNQ